MSLLRSIVSAACAALLIVSLPVGVPAEAPITAEAKSPTEKFFVIPIPVCAQEIIARLGDETQLSTELIMAIFYVEEMSDFSLTRIESEIDSLVALRDYWNLQGYSNETVFVLMLLSRDRGIDGSLIFMANNGNPDDDVYLQSVIRVKYELEQSIYTFDALETLDKQISPRGY